MSHDPLSHDAKSHDAASHARRLLAVGFPITEFDRLSTAFDPSWDVDLLPSGQSALDLLKHCPLDLVIVRHPLPDLSLQDFLDGLRGHKTQSRSASLILVTERDRAREVCAFIGRGANRVLSIERAHELLEPTIHALLRIAPRRPASFSARLEMPRLGSFLGVVRNTSRTGLLVETEQLPTRGTELGFELDVPSAAPIFGRAKVVRHAAPDREGVVGLGMRITAFDGREAGRRYSALVES